MQGRRRLEMMRLYSYIVAFDGGFAPCVRGSICTLACCKPRIRAKVEKGDWVAGTTPTKRGAGGLVYLMRVDGVLSFGEYWRKRRFRGRNDNIYCPVGTGGFKGYKQMKNPWHGRENVRKDLSADRALTSKTFVYYGEKAPTIPAAFLRFVPRGRGHRVFGEGLGEAQDLEMSAKIRPFLRWAFSHGGGIKGRPFDEPSRHRTCSS